MFEKRDFINEHAQVIDDEVKSTLGHIEPKLKENGFAKLDLTFNVLPGVLFLVLEDVEHSLRDAGWSVNYSVNENYLSRPNQSTPVSIEVRWSRLKSTLSLIVYSCADFA